MRFLVDAQLPPSFAKVLCEQGHLAEHLDEIGLRQAKDKAIWDYALQHQAAILTKDEDFVERFRRGHVGPKIIWLRIGNASNRTLLAWFMPILPVVVARLQAGDSFIEVR